MVNILKLGKLPKRFDARTLKLKNFLVYRNLPPLPDTFDTDSIFVNFSNNHMFANDRYGDCVIAGRAHMTLRFECFEESKVIPITDAEVTTEYFKETGGSDSGLNMLNSLNEWRQSGWTASGKLYDIHAYAEIDKSNHNELKYTVYLLRGAYTGFSVPQSAMDQFNAGQPWTVVKNSPIVGGHCVYIKGYNAIGPICVTWGADQQMTWEFWDTYFDEAYGVIDNRNTWCDPATDPLNITELDAQLAEITSAPPNPTPPPPTPSPCKVGGTIAKISSVIPWALHRKGRFYYMNSSSKSPSLLKKLKATVVHYKTSMFTIFSGILMLAGSAIMEFHSLWQLDIISVQPLWNTIHWIAYWVAEHPNEIYSNIRFEDGPIFIGTEGEAWNFFLGMNATAWVLALVAMFFIMLGIAMLYKQQLNELKKANRKV